MSKKLFIFSDVHGAYDAMICALNKVGYNPKNSNHQIIALGDYFGRAETNLGDSVKVFEYLTNVIHINKPICLRGNHESILLDIFRRGFLTYIDCRNGEDITIGSFNRIRRDEVLYDYDAIDNAAKILEKWIMELPWYYETENNIFVHGFLPHPWEDIGQWDKYNSNDWHHASWSKTPSEVFSFSNHFPHGLNKTINVGHWHAFDFINAESPQEQYDYAGKIFQDKELKINFLDCCTALKHGMEVLVIEDEVYGK